MKCLLPATVLLSVVLFLAEPVEANRYGWTISNSDTDPFSNTGSATSVFTTLYLWFQCSDTDGMSAAEFDISASGISHLATVTENYFLNAGSTSDLLLAVGGCPEGPVVAAKLHVIDLPGELCIVPSAANAISGTVDCGAAPELWTLDWIGYSNNGSDAPCGQGALCRNALLEDTSWSEIKTLYR